MRMRAAPPRGAAITTAGTMSPFEHRLGPARGREPVQRVPFRDDVARRLPVAAAALVDPAQSLVERAVGGLLQLGVERRLHLEACLVQLVGRELLLEVLADLLDEVRRNRSIRRRLSLDDERARGGGVGLLAGDEAFVRHARQDVVVAPRQRLFRVDERAEARRRLDDRRDRRGFLERQVLRRLVEVQARAGLDAVRAVAHRHVVGVEGEDLALRVALFELHGDDRLLDLPLEAAHAGSLKDAALHVVLQEQHARDLLGNRAGAEPLPVEHVLDRGDDDARDAQAEVLLEVGVLAGEDRLAQRRRHLVVADDDAPFDGELADHLAVAGEDAGDGVRLVAVERADFGEIVGVGEEDAAQGAEERRRDEQDHEPRLPGDADHNRALGHCVSTSYRGSDLGVRPRVRPRVRPLV